MTLDIINRDNVSDNATLNLNLPHQVATAEVGGITYLFVPGVLDNGVSVFAVGADGVLTNVENVNDDATLNLAGALNVATAVVGGTTYLIVAGNFDDGLSVFEVAAGGTLINVDNVADDATTLFESPNWLTTAVVGGTAYLFAVGANDNGLSVFEIGATGVLTNVDNIADDATLMLTAATSATAVAVGGTTFLFVAGLLDAGVSVFEVGSDGRLTNVSNVADNATVNLLNPSGVTTAVVGGTTYLFVAAFGDSGVSVFEVGSDGSLFNVENVSDNATLNLSGANSVTTAVVGGTTYLFVTSGLDNGASVFEVGTDGSLVNVANIADDASLELEGAAAATTAVVGGTSYLFVSGGDDNGISAFELSNNGALIGTNLSDTLVGTSAADTIEGLGANDVILGLADNDALNGGDGADTLTGGDGDDTLTGGAGDDDLYGDAGTDTAVFAGNSTDYLIDDLGNGVFAITGQGAFAAQGIDILHGIENAAFDDGILRLQGMSTAPTDIALSHNTIAENSAAGALVGVLSASDPDAGETFTYQLLDDAGGRFVLSGNLIEVVGPLNFEAASSHQVTVRVTDSAGLTRDETFTIGVTDVAEGAAPGGGGLSIINRDNVTDDATLALAGAQSVATAVVGGVTYLFVAGIIDSGVSVFRVDADGALTNVANVFDDATLNLGLAVSVTTAVVGGTTYLFAAGVLDGVSVFRVDAGGSLANVANVADDATLELSGAVAVTTAAVGGVTYLFVAGSTDSGVSVFSVDAGGALANVANVTDDATLRLGNVLSVATAAAGGVTYLFAAGTDDGVSVFRVDAGGALANVENFQFGAAADLDLSFVSSLATAVVGGVTYLFTASTDFDAGNVSRFSGVRVFEVAADGSLAPVDDIGDSPARFLDQGGSVTTAVIGGTAYLFVANNVESGLSVFSIGAGGVLSNVANIGDDATLQLFGATSVTTAVAGGIPYLFATGAVDDGVSVFELATGATAGGPNTAPTDIALSHNTIAENSATGALVGALSASDPDTGETFTYQLLDDAGGRFAINGNLIEVAGALDFETAASHQVTVRVTDSAGLTRDETFTIGVTDVAEVTPGAASIYAIAALQSEVTEGDSGTTARLTFIVSRVGDISAAGSVDYRLGGTNLPGAATASDFAGTFPTTGTVTFAAGEASKVITLDVQGDDLFEATETLTVELTNPSSGQVGAAARVTILNDDAGAVASSYVLRGTDPFGIDTDLSFGDGLYNNINFVDIDNDGDLDLYHLSNRSFQENIGTADAPDFAAPVDASVFGLNFHWTFADIDGDGDFDALAGRSFSATTGFLRNDGSALTPAFAGVSAVFDSGGVLPLSAVSGALPEFADIDNDGDLDLFHGGADGNLRFYQNTGTATAGVWRAPNDAFGANSLVVNPFGLVSTGITQSAIEFGDVDRDGDLDAIVTGFAAGGAPALIYYENTGDPQNPSFRVADVNPFAGVDLRAISEGSRPTLVDIDGDGDLDLFIHEAQSVSGGGILFYENTAPPLVGGTPGNDVLIGTSSADAINGLAGNDRIEGREGDDVLEGGAGDDTLLGEGGSDTAVFSGRITDYSITDLGGGRFEVVDLRAGSPDGTDALDSIETLQFSDGTVDLTIPPNEAPVAQQGAESGEANTVIVGHASATDADNPASDLHFRLNGGNGGALHGVVTLNDDGSFSYAPVAGFTGLDSFSFVTNDGRADSNTATIDITVNPVSPPVNQAPVAQNGTASGNAGAIIAGQAIATDADTPAAGLDYHLAGANGGAQHGTVALNADGSFIYVPAAGFSGTDSFSFVTNDGLTDSNTATIDIVVTQSGTMIAGSAGRDIISGTSAPAGQPQATDQDDIVHGNGGDDSIGTLGGDDFIDGGAGRDRMEGGAGNDTYIVDNRGDRVIEQPGAGVDQVFSSISFSLAAQVDDLTLTGTDNINGNGNGLANTIVGNAGNNILDGRGGNDTFVFAGNFGNDTVRSFVGNGTGTGDAIQFDRAVFADFAAMLAATTDTGSNLVIDAGAFGTVTLHRVGNVSLLDASDFTFV